MSLRERLICCVVGALALVAVLFMGVDQVLACLLAAYSAGVVGERISGAVWRWRKGANETEPV